MTEMHIPVTKAGPGQTVLIDTDKVDEGIYVKALFEGFKALVNGGASKLTPYSKATNDDERAKFRAAAMELAEARVVQMNDGTLKVGRGASKSDDVPAAVKVEARRIAKELIKDTIKKNGGKVSHYKPSEITAAANDLIADPTNGPGFIEMAKENLANRKKSNIAITLPTLKEDPKMVAKAEEAKLQKKAKTLSVAQSGKVTPRVAPAGAVKH